MPCTLLKPNLYGSMIQGLQQHHYNHYTHYNQHRKDTQDFPRLTFLTRCHYCMEVTSSHQILTFGHKVPRRHVVLKYKFFFIDKVSKHHKYLNVFDL